MGGRGGSSQVLLAPRSAAKALERCHRFIFVSSSQPPSFYEGFIALQDHEMTRGSSQLWSNEKKMFEMQTVDYYNLALHCRIRLAL